MSVSRNATSNHKETPTEVQSYAQEVIRDQIIPKVFNKHSTESSSRRMSGRDKAPGLSQAPINPSGKVESGAENAVPSATASNPNVAGGGTHHVPHDQGTDGLHRSVSDSVVETGFAKEVTDEQLQTMLIERLGLVTSNAPAINEAQLPLNVLSGMLESDEKKSREVEMFLQEKGAEGVSALLPDGVVAAAPQGGGGGVKDVLEASKHETLGKEEKGKSKDGKGGKRGYEESFAEGFPKRYEVLVQARVRMGKDLGSEHITDLPEGTSVTVAEIDGRRARIIMPIHGWVSVRTRMGGKILIPTDTNHSKVGLQVIVGEGKEKGKGKIVDYDETTRQHKVRMDDGGETMVDIKSSQITVLTNPRDDKNKLSGDAPIFDPKAEGGKSNLALFHQIFALDYPEYVGKQRAELRAMAAHAHERAKQRYAMSHGHRGLPPGVAYPSINGEDRRAVAANARAHKNGVSGERMGHARQVHKSSRGDKVSDVDYTRRSVSPGEKSSRHKIRAAPDVSSRTIQGKKHKVCGLIVLRGLPGSGKTTLARKLAARAKNAKICTEDKYHWSGNEDGVGSYKFKPELVFLAREWCTKEIRQCIKQRVSLIILDNHNARISMYEEHIQYAVRAGYRFRIIEFIAREDLIDRYRERSYKKFPREVYVKLLKLWEKDPRAELVNPMFGPKEEGTSKKGPTSGKVTTSGGEANHRDLVSADKKASSKAESGSQKTSAERVASNGSPHESSRSAAGHGAPVAAPINVSRKHGTYTHREAEAYARSSSRHHRSYEESTSRSSRSAASAGYVMAGHAYQGVSPKSTRQSSSSSRMHGHGHSHGHGHVSPPTHAIPRSKGSHEYARVSQHYAQQAAHSHSGSHGAHGAYSHGHGHGHTHGHSHGSHGHSHSSHSHSHGHGHGHSHRSGAYGYPPNEHSAPDGYAHGHSHSHGHGHGHGHGHHHYQQVGYHQ